MDIKKPQLVKVEAFAYFFEGSSATPSEIFGKMNGATSSRGRSVLTMTNILCGYSFFDEVGIGVDEVDYAVVIGGVLVAYAS